MSFPRAETNNSPESVQAKAMELNALCRAAYLNYVNQLVPADLSKKDTIKTAMQTKEAANDAIDLVLKEKIIAVNNSLKEDLKKLKDTKDELRIIVEKALNKNKLTDSDVAQLAKYRIDETVLASIAVEKKKVDEASSVLFKLAVNPPAPSKESAVARQTLLSYVSYDILVANSDVEKAKAIEHWTQVLNTMLEGGNYYGAYVLVKALNDGKIKELNAMQQVSTESKEVLAKATEIFASSKNMNAHMEASAKAGKFVIPSLHNDEGALVGCSQKTDYVGWNSIIGKLEPYTQALKSKPAPILSGPFVSALLQGKISETVVLTQDKQSKTEVSLVSIVEARRKSTLKAEEFNDLLSVKSGIASSLEVMQNYIDSRAEHTQPKVIQRRAILMNLVAEAKRTINSFASLSDSEQQQALLKKIEIALNDQAIATRIGTEKGHTQTHVMISKLGELVAQLNRKTSRTEVRREELEEKAAPEQPAVSSAEKPIYIGPRYIPPLSKMQAILNRIDDPELVQNAAQLKSAMKVLMEQKALRKHDRLFDPVAQSPTVMADYMRNQQDKLEMRQDRLEEEWRNAKVVYHAIQYLQESGVAPPKEVSKLIAGFNHHLQKMTLDAMNHPNPDLLSDIQKLKLSRVMKPKVQVSEVVSVKSNPVDDHERKIAVLKQERDAVFADHYSRERGAALQGKGKEDMPKLNDADRQKVEGLNAEIDKLQAAYANLYKRTKNNKVDAVTSQPVALEPQPVVATAEKSTMMRLLDRVRGLLGGKSKASADAAARTAPVKNDQSYKAMARTIDPAGGGKAVLTESHAGMEEVKVPNKTPTTPAVNVAEPAVADPVQPEGTTIKMKK